MLGYCTATVGPSHWLPLSESRNLRKTTYCTVLLCCTVHYGTPIKAATTADHAPGVIHRTVHWPLLRTLPPPIPCVQYGSATAQHLDKALGRRRDQDRLSLWSKLACPFTNYDPPANFQSGIPGRQPLLPNREPQPRSRAVQTTNN